MAEEEDTGEKTEEPTQHRIDEFREKGQVAISKELVSVMILTASVTALFLSSVYLFEIFIDLFQYVAHLKHDTIFTKNGPHLLTIKIVTTFFKAILPVAVASFTMSIFSHVVQTGFVYAPDVLEMKLERINPLEGLKKLVSLRIIFELAKAIFKFVLAVVVSYYLVKGPIYDLNGVLQVDILQTFVFGKMLATKFAYTLILVFFAIAIADFSWEKFQYKKKLQQTRHQAKEELKEKEGNPEIKQRIRSVQREVAHKRMMADVEKADVIVANPTHISVALKYDKEKMFAPVVVAKGADFVALKIRELAKEHNVPIVENVPLARTLYATVKVGEVIPRSLYKAIADILNYVYKLKKKEKAII